MIVSIHQPQYLPWAAYMYKVMMSDVFILFDTVQYARGFSNRNQIKSPNGSMWLTVPVQRAENGISFRDTLVQDQLNWAGRHWTALKNSYQKGCGWDEIAADMKMLYDTDAWSSISDLDEAFLKLFAAKLGFKTKIVRASDLGVDPAAYAGVDYLIALTKAVDGDTYLSGRGAGSLRYVSEPPFNAAGIELITYNFASPVYPQLWGDFVADLSVVDLIACRGFTETRTTMEGAGSLLSWPDSGR